MPLRAAVFAHFDRDSIVDEYVIYYLKELQKVTEVIIFVSDSHLSDYEQKKVTTLGISCIAERHGEYDFGSYKRGFFALNDRDQYDEIVFCNDSCYGPLFPLSEVFSSMERGNCDYWGMTQNNCGIDIASPEPLLFPHIQSYFVVFRKMVFLSEHFLSFIHSVELENDKIQVIIKYEMGLTSALSAFQSGTYIPANDSMDNPTHAQWDTIITANRFPLLKVDLIRDNTPKVNMFGWKNVISYSGYATILIKKHLKRVQNRASFKTLYKSANRHFGMFHPVTLYWLIMKLFCPKENQ